MKFVKHLILAEILLSSFLIPVVFSQDFDFTGSCPDLFTIGKKEKIELYIKNNDNFVGRTFTISYTKEAWGYSDGGEFDLSHLISVEFPSNITVVGPNEIKSTVATVIFLGPFQTGKITFTARTGEATRTYEVKIGPGQKKLGYSVTLNEFSFISLLIVATSIIYLKMKITKNY